MMRIDVVTIFPGLFDALLSTSLLGKAIASKRLTIAVHDLRRWGVGKHRAVDDQPYGGGPGMVMRPEPFFLAVDALRSERSEVILLSPRGERLDHRRVVTLAEVEHLILLCGRYEGVDERVSLHLVDGEISIGDYVLAGGELPAMVVIEAVTRHVPGVLGNVGSLDHESHAARGLEHAHYTRPPSYRGHAVPETLLSGHHDEIGRWRAEESRRTTRGRRPDLL